MQVRKFRWSKVYESTEEELVALLRQKHIAAQRWVAAEGEESTKKYPIAMQLWCAEGQLTCTVGGRAYSLQPGDALDIPAGQSCSVRGGFGGCACYESAALQSGVL